MFLKCFETSDSCSKLWKDKDMKDENKKPVRKHVERRVRFNDTYIKGKKPRDKLYSEGDSEVPGLRIYIQPSGMIVFYYAYKPLNQENWVQLT